MRYGRRRRSRRGGREGQPRRPATTRRWAALRMLALAYDGLEAARHHDSVVALQPDLLVELMTPLRRDRPGPLIGRARHPLRTRRRMQASNKPKSMGAHTVAYHAHIFVGGPLRIHGYLGVPGSRMPVQPPDTRTSGSLPRARPRFDKSASRTACETTCESYITLNPRVNMRHAHSGSCSMAA